MTAVKEAKGNSLQNGAHCAVDGRARMVQEAAGELRVLAEDVCSESGLVVSEEIVRSCVFHLHHHLHVDAHSKYMCIHISLASSVGLLSSLVKWTLSR